MIFLLIWPDIPAVLFIEYSSNTARFSLLKTLNVLEIDIKNLRLNLIRHTFNLFSSLIGAEESLTLNS